MKLTHNQYVIPDSAGSGSILLLSVICYQKLKLVTSDIHNLPAAQPLSYWYGKTWEQWSVTASFY